METHLSACHRVRGPRFAPLCLRPTGTVLCHVAIEGGTSLAQRAHEPTGEQTSRPSLHHPRLLPLHSWGKGMEGTHRLHKLRAQQASKKSFIKGLTWLQPSNRDDRRGVWCQRKLSRGSAQVARTRISKQDLGMNHWGGLHRSPTSARRQRKKERKGYQFVRESRGPVCPKHAPISAAVQGRPWVGWERPGPTGMAWKENEKLDPIDNTQSGARGTEP